MIIYGRPQEPPEQRQFRFGLKQVFIAMTAFAAMVFVAIWLWRGLPDARSAAVRSAYQNGKITLQEARQELGNAVDDWPSHIHEQAELHRANLTQRSTKTVAAPSNGSNELGQ